MEVPEGYALVPLEPTDEMLHACQAALKNFIRSLSQEEKVQRWGRAAGGLSPKMGYRVKPYEKARIRYKAMIEASNSRPDHPNGGDQSKMIRPNPICS